MLSESDRARETMVGSEQLAEKIAAEKTRFSRTRLKANTWTGHATLVREITRSYRASETVRRVLWHLRRWRRFTSGHRARFT